MMSPVYRGRAVQPGTAMIAHGDEARCPTGTGPFFSSGAPSSPPSRRCRPPAAEADLPTRYLTHPKQRGGERYVVDHRLYLWCSDDAVRACYRTASRSRNWIWMAAVPHRSTDYLLKGADVETRSFACSCGMDTAVDQQSSGTSKERPIVHRSLVGADRLWTVSRSRSGGERPCL